MNTFYQPSRMLAVLFFPLLIAACGPAVTYQEDYSVRVDFSQLKTYAWHQGNEHNKSTRDYIANEFIDERIRSDIEKELAKKGFEKTTEDQAALFVNYTITVEDQIDVSNYNVYGGVYSDWSWGNARGYPGYMGSSYRYYSATYTPTKIGTDTEITHHQEGTFVVDIVNPANEKLIWRGSAHGKLHKKNLSHEKLDNILAEIVNKTLHDFPPKKIVLKN